MQLFLSGNQSIAHGVKLSRVEVISAYPITPATPASETIYEMVDRGEFDAEVVNAESEIGAMGICVGAAATGCRTFSATCSQGLALMREMLWAASGMALPIVLAIDSREFGNPQALLSDHSDNLSERDASFLQFICEDGQEIIDSIIMAYRISEDERVLLPSFVVSEGHRLSHSFELVDIPEQEEVDKFLPKYQPKHIFIDPQHPTNLGSPVGALHYPGLKRQQYEAMQEAKNVIREVCQEYAQLVGRHYGLIETYGTNDAELIIIAMGSVVGALKDKVDEYQQRGIKLGLLKLRVFRPFPDDEIRDALSAAKKILVIDRSCSPGNTDGISCIEIKAAMQGSQATISNVIISSNDIDSDDIDQILNTWLKTEEKYVEWYKAGFDQRATTASGYDNYIKSVHGEEVIGPPQVKGGEKLLGRGNASCAGCLSLLAIRQALEVFDNDTIISNNSGCMEGASSYWPLTAWKVPHSFFTYSHAGAAVSGIEIALKKKKVDANVILIAGDGAIFDIGLQTFSAALERGHRIIYICYDNQAYMMTGVQRSGATPRMTKTKTTLSGRETRVKDIVQIVAAHGDIYIATASPAFPDDLKRKLKKAKGLNKPSFIHLNCPCPPGWGYDPALGIEIARLAIETGIFVLYEYDNGKVTLNKLPKSLKPVEEYLMKQGRFSHLTKEQIDEIQMDVSRNVELLKAGVLV